STVKVTAIVAFILIGIGILAFSGNPAYGLRNLTAGGHRDHFNAQIAENGHDHREPHALDAKRHEAAG
ncbi:hypothetical protein, partial [Serratia ureilytica]|uniref:hypothetical protein n=1 Tax=Serratia ureilytica TaxID=300181 RepID=UPI002549F356